MGKGKQQTPMHGTTEQGQPSRRKASRQGRAAEKNVIKGIEGMKSAMPHRSEKQKAEPCEISRALTSRSLLPSNSRSGVESNCAEAFDVVASLQRTPKYVCTQNSILVVFLLCSRKPNGVMDSTSVRTRSERDNKDRIAKSAANGQRAFIETLVLA